MPNEEKTFSNEDVKALIEQNRQILAQLTTLKAAVAEGNTRSPVATEIKMHTCTLLFVNDMPVVGLKNKGSQSRPLFLYDKQDPNRRNEYFLFADVQVLSSLSEKGEAKYEVVTLDWNEFLEQADRADCQIITQKRIPWTKESGTTMKRVVDTDYKIEVDAPVPVIVEGFRQLLTVRIPKGQFEGRNIDIDEQYVNMAK